MRRGFYEKNREYFSYYRYGMFVGCLQKEVDQTNMQKEDVILSTVTISEEEKDKISDSEHTEQNKA